jgi:membrane protein DedA with SNARE-associated domain
VFDFLYHLLTDAPQAYLIVFAVAAGDAVLPILPSETLVILGGVFAAHGRLDLTAVIVAGALGATLGDNVSYWVGRGGGAPIRRRLERRPKFADKLEWARGRLRAGGGYIIPVSRFVPGGRTAVTFSAGALSFPWIRFLGLSTVGGVVWSLYAGLVGYFGGRTFENSEWKALVLAFAIAAVVTLLIEGGRRVAGRRA